MYWADLVMLLLCKEINLVLGKALLWTSGHQHVCLAPEDRVYFFCLYFVYLTLTQLFFTSFLLSVSWNVSTSQETGKEGVMGSFPYSETISTLFLKYRRTKATCFYALDPSRLQSNPFYFYLVMQGNTCISSSSLACGWNICQHIIASTSRNSFKLILRGSLLCLQFHRAGSATNWQGILQGWNNECFLSLRNNYWMLWVRLTKK